MLFGLQKVQYIVAQHLLSSCIPTASKFDANGKAGASHSTDVSLPYGLQICPLKRPSDCLVPWTGTLRLVPVAAPGFSKEDEHAREHKHELGSSMTEVNMKQA